MRLLAIVVLIVTIFFGTGLSRAAGHPTSEKDFSALSEKVIDSVDQALERGDLTGSLAIVKRWIFRYEQFTPKMQSRYRSQAANMFYLAASIYGSERDSLHSVSSFEKAVDDGFSDYALAESDPHLVVIRQSSVFEPECRKMAEHGVYLTLLRNCGSYDKHASPRDLKFSYVDPSQPHLAALRREEGLDSVAGNGDERSRIIRLMRWAHDIVPHIGTHPEPRDRTAIDLISVSHRENRGLDCGALARILNEAYLAEGFASRVIDCMPSDTAEIEHHIITSVYMRSIGKWVWMDPTNEAYITDERGEMLGVEEIRARLIADGNMYLNPEANWNHTISFTAEKYIYEYLPKNLYWFHCPLNSGTAGGRYDYIALMPSGYRPYGKKPVQLSAGKAYFTSDARYFWQSPDLLSSPQ
jgi:hypothetical protein